MTVNMYQNSTISASGCRLSSKHVARLEGERNLVLSDTSWFGYETIPQWVIGEYATILQEIDEELARWQQHGPDLVVVQIGVGALAASVEGQSRD